MDFSAAISAIESAMP
jgi:putative Ca2+/H+ antiporter (TMEM165/GDT1 family)